MRRSSELRHILFGQYIAESQCFLTDFVITEHPHQYFLVNWCPRVVEHHRGDEGAAKAELVAWNRDAEPRSSGTKINFRLCLSFFGLSLCGYCLCQNHANHNGQMKSVFHLCIPRSLVRQFQTSCSVEPMARGNKSTRVQVTQLSFSSFVVTSRAMPG